MDGVEGRGSPDGWALPTDAIPTGLRAAPDRWLSMERAALVLGKALT